MANKHIIWSNTQGITDADRENIRANLIENGITDITDAMVETEYWETNNQYFQDEEINLKKHLQGRVLCIADLGLWNGKHSGYRIMGPNLNEVLHAEQGDLYEVYSDGRNIRANDIHHDGTNRYLFREIREEKNIDNLLAKIYAGTATSRDISYYTKSLAPYVADVYGWTAKSRKAA